MSPCSLSRILTQVSSTTFWKASNFKLFQSKRKNKYHEVFGLILYFLSPSLLWKEQHLRAPADCRCDDVRGGDWCYVLLRESSWERTHFSDIKGLAATFLSNGFPQNQGDTNSALNNFQSLSGLKEQSQAEHLAVQFCRRNEVLNFTRCGLQWVLIL